MVLSTDTELKIIASAERLFCQKGKAGTSMQDIADDAGINRTLLNYYFRSKDLLFEAVFRKALEVIVPKMVRMLQSEMTFSDYVQNMIPTIIDTMIESPQIPIFVLQELSSDPERIPQIMKELGIDPSIVFRKFESEQARTVRDSFDPRQMIINILSLCIFPFAARPVITEILFNGDHQEYLAAMRQRKELLQEMFRKYLNQIQ
jgi:AcrR family transcriptional regulator